MVTLTVKLNVPTDMAAQLAEQGLLEDSAKLAQTLLNELERYLAWQRIEKTFATLDAADDPIPMDEIVAAVKEVRAERRKQREGRS